MANTKPRRVIVDEILSDDEKRIIRAYAALPAGVANATLRERATAIYEAHIAEHVKRDRNRCPEIEFMSEVLSPCPDYAYRSLLRRKITAPFFEQNEGT